MGQDCKYCGAYISGREDKCPACGKRVYTGLASSAATAAATDEREEKKTEAYTYKDEYERRYGVAGQEKGSTGGAGSGNADVLENRALCYLCYLGPLFLIPYLTKRDSEFVRFHSNQGLLLLLACILINIAKEIVPFIGWLIGLVGALFTISCFIKGLGSVSKGEKNKLPVIGDITLLS